MSRDDELATALDPLADSARGEPGPAGVPGVGRVADDDALGQVREALSAESSWDDPPPGLRELILARASEERAQLDSRADRTARAEDHEARDHGVAPDRPTAVPERLGAAPRDRRVRERPRRAHSHRPRQVSGWFAALAGAAVTAAAAAVLVAGPLADRGPAGEVAALAVTELAPDAEVTAYLDEQRAGFAITLEITGLPPAPEGSYYAAWLRGPSGTVPIGTFHWRSGGIPIELWSGVDPADYPELVVSLQDEGAAAVLDDERAFLVGRVAGTDGEQ